MTAGDRGSPADERCRAGDGQVDLRRGARDGSRWSRPRAGTVAFPKLRRGDAAEFAARLVEAEGVLLLPGACFDADGSRFRIGLGRRDFAAGLARLAAFVDSLSW